MVSKARRAAAIAACMSSAPPSATSPITASVAGFTFAKRAPERASTNRPSMYMRPSGRLKSVMVVRRLLGRAAF